MASSTKSINKLSLQNRSRFVRQLTELSAQKLTVAEYNLAERLGHFVGVAGSMSLARGLRNLPSQAAQKLADDPEEVQSGVLAERARMIKAIVDSFSPKSAPSQTTVPSVATGVRVEALKTFDPYQRFYTTQQLEIAVGVKNLRAQVRAAMSGFSPSLHRLAALDETLDESLEAHARKLFNVSSKLLEQRFKALLAKTKPNDIEADIRASAEADYKPPAWLISFYQDMRELLLAELDMRLQPVLGLLEALNEHQDTFHD